MAVFVTGSRGSACSTGITTASRAARLGAFELAIFVRAVVLTICVIAWIRSGAKPLPRSNRRPPDAESVLGVQVPA